jgi:hypothetical protein
MGAVYRARQKDLDRQVALKVLPPEVGADPAFAERFLREARALAKLNHPHIVVVYDYGQAGEFYYFMMEYVEGTNLRHLMTSGRLPPTEALAIIPQICDALQFAHNQGVVHRDVKPENILVSKQGNVKIADFGLVKLLDAAPADYSLTGTQQVMGTLHYMAPEQVQHTHAVDHRADIYSLGVVFYEMLTGQLPIGRFDPPSSRADIDVRLDEIVLRSLESDPLRRYQQASHVRTDIESLPHMLRVQADASLSTPAKPPEHEREPAPPKPPESDREHPRFSRKAIIGVLWAPMLFVTLFLTLFTVRASEVPPPAARNETAVVQPDGSVVRVDHAATAERSHVRRASQEQTAKVHTNFRYYGWMHLILATVILLPGLTAPLGTTILGCSALGDIRRAEGRLLGLPLAIFDALLYPLLLLDALVFLAVGSVCAFASVLLARFASASGMTVMFAVAFTFIPSLVICLILDFFIVRAVWRRYR